MRFSCLTTLLLVFGCGEDPILAKANSDQPQNNVSTSADKTVEKEEQKSETQQTMPTIAPPKDSPKVDGGQLPKVAPPAVEPPNEQPKEAVPPPPPNPKDCEFLRFRTIEANNPTNHPIDILKGSEKHRRQRPSVVVSTTVESSSV